MQPSQRVATPIASAISSLVPCDSAPSPIDALAIASKPAMVPAASVRILRVIAPMSAVSWA
jgi:hypothetical protein